MLLNTKILSRLMPMTRLSCFTSMTRLINQCANVVDRDSVKPDETLPNHYGVCFLSKIRINDCVAEMFSRVTNVLATCLNKTCWRHYAESFQGGVVEPRETLVAFCNVILCIIISHDGYFWISDSRNWSDYWLTSPDVISTMEMHLDSEMSMKVS